jgi:hypothetical protein
MSLARPELALVPVRAGHHQQTSTPVEILARWVRGCSGSALRSVGLVGAVVSGIGQVATQRPSARAVVVVAAVRPLHRRAHVEDERANRADRADGVVLGDSLAGGLAVQQSGGIDEHNGRVNCGRIDTSIGGRVIGAASSDEQNDGDMAHPPSVSRSAGFSHSLSLLFFRLNVHANGCEGRTRSHA